MQSEKKIIIVDITSLRKDKQSFGHYFSVAQMYSELFKNHEDIYIAGGPIYKEKFDNLIELKYDVDLREFQNKISKIKAKIKEFLNAKYILKNYKDSVLIFQDYSNLVLFLSIYLFKTTNKIYLIQYKDETKNKLQGKIFNKIRNKVNGIICPKESIGKAYGVPYSIVPDYIYTESKANEIKEYNLDYDFGVFGIIRPGKDVVGVARLFMKNNLKLIIAGSVQDDKMLKELKKISEESSNIEFLNEYLSQEKYDELIGRTKCVILPYIDDYYNESSSGVVFDILFRKKPVVIRKYEVFNFIEENSIGYLYNKLEDLELDQFIEEGQYNIYQNNIDKYLELNKCHAESLIKFIEA